MTISELIILARKEKKITRTMQACELGISAQTLCDVENGRRRVSPGRAFLWGETLMGEGQLWLQVAIESLVEHDFRKLGLNAKVNCFIKLNEKSGTR